ncbi:MAG: hypothetical protein K2J10_07570, partial [Muribaculaceae bacterium]|nr:hypothetical protein [Muribaculaceae bacterium]
ESHTFCPFRTLRPWNCPVKQNGQRRGLTRDKYINKPTADTHASANGWIYTIHKASTAASFLT